MYYYSKDIQILSIKLVELLPVPGFCVGVGVVVVSIAVLVTASEDEFTVISGVIIVVLGKIGGLKNVLPVEDRSVISGMPEKKNYTNNSMYITVGDNLFTIVLFIPFK